MKRRTAGRYSFIAVILVLAGLLSACGAAVPAPPPSESLTAEVTQTPTPTPSPAPTPTPTPAPTPTPTPTPTPAPSESAPVAANSLPEKDRAGDEYFADAVFIGNSLVDGLYLYGGVTGCKWLSGTGLSIYNIDTLKLSDKAGGECTVAEGLASAEFGKVYLMLGINEIGAQTEDFAASYGAIVDKIKQLQPNAALYVMSLTPVSEKKSAESEYFTREKVQCYNEALQALCEEKGVYYLDCYTPFADENGYLPEDASSDGIHFSAANYGAWMDLIRTHYA